jgi:hypothetical protein
MSISILDLPVEILAKIVTYDFSIFRTAIVTPGLGQLLIAKTSILV